MADSDEAGLAALNDIAEELAEYPWLHSARAEILLRMGRYDEATVGFRTAISLTNNRDTRAHLEDRLLGLS
jgi:RNA polymerase sigma-70 factor (ECF subfamily)